MPVAYLPCPALLSFYSYFSLLLSFFNHQLSLPSFHAASMLIYYHLYLYYLQLQSKDTSMGLLFATSATVLAVLMVVWMTNRFLHQTNLKKPTIIPVSVNFHFTRKCNCKAPMAKQDSMQVLKARQHTICHLPRL